MKSLIKGEKQIDLFVPTAYTDSLQETKDEMVLITSTAEQKEGCKIRRSCILGGVKLGKGVEIVNSVILKNTFIEDK
jgi:NDP-sugar pyrophosphorylase family protein